MALGFGIWPESPVATWPTPPETTVATGPATQTLLVIDQPAVPGRWERRCESGVCSQVWVAEVPATWRLIVVKAGIPQVDERALVAYHYRLGPGSCGMIGCVTHPGRSVLVDDFGNPAPAAAAQTEAKADGHWEVITGRRGIRKRQVWVAD